LAETAKVLPREPLTTYERDTFSTNCPINCNLFTTAFELFLKKL
ncbi:hypothetical protein SAMN05216366_12282, partial [Selenomonas ruminantium]